MPRKPPERVVVITGASNGPGRAIALEFALHGDALVLGSRREGPLESVRRECEALHALTLAQVTDLSDDSSAFTLANAALARFRRVDIWINYAPPLPLLRGDVTPVDAFGENAVFDLSGYENGAAAALACFKALGGGVLINVDSLIGGAPPGFETAFAEARRQVQETFTRVEQEARNVPGVRVISVLPPRLPIASETLAPMIVSLARAGSRSGIVGRVLGAMERERFRVWTRMVPTHRKAARPEPLVSAGPGDASPWSTTDDFAPQDRVVSQDRVDPQDRVAPSPSSAGGVPILEGGSTRRHGSWHLVSTSSARESASTIALLVGVPVVVLVGALLLVRG